jgi:23S rRNA (uracil1939-C5)-methyltransferase
MHTPDAVLCIVSARGFGAQTDGLIAYLREHCPELTGIVLDVNKQKGNVVLAGDFYPLWGVPELTDRLCGLTFTLSPQAFYQVNPVQAERLYERAVEYAVNAPTDQVLDLYCGAGTISLCLARKAAHVIGAEIVPEAIENARRNAERNGIENAEFLCADAGAAAAELAGLHRGRSPAQGHVPGSHRRDGVHAAAAHRLCLLRSGHARARCEAAHTARLHAHAGAGRGHVPADAAC